MNKSIYQKPSKDITVLCEYDVVVCGGGAAGCAAAVTAAKCGAKTLLIEKYGYLGGATTAQLVIAVLSTNGVDFQGVWHQYANALKKRNGISELIYDPRFDYIICGSVDSEAVKYAWDDLLTEANVDVLHHAIVMDTIVENSVIKGLCVYTKSGEHAIMAKRIIDCTGDGEVCSIAGVPWEQGDGDSKFAMSMSKIFKYGNVPIFENAISGLGGIGFGRSMGNNLNLRMGVGKRLLNINPLDPWDMTKAEREGRDSAWEIVEVRKKQEGYENVCIAETSMHVGVRSSRRIKGHAVATENDAWNFIKYDDEIAKSSWDIDIWPANDATKPTVARSNEKYKLRIEKMKKGDYFSIRYGSLTPLGVENLLVAGRCISSEHVAQSSLRIQQTCMSTGEAAGAAAAISIKDNINSSKLDVNILQKYLSEIRENIEPAFKILKNKEW